MFCVDCSCGPTPAITSRSGPQAQACPCQAHGQGCHWSWFGEEQRDAIHGRTGIRKDARRKKPVGMTTNQIPSAGRSYPWPHHRKWRGACSLGIPGSAITRMSCGARARAQKRNPPVSTRQAARAGNTRFAQNKGARCAARPRAKTRSARLNAAGSARGQYPVRP